MEGKYTSKLICGFYTVTTIVMLTNGNFVFGAVKQILYNTNGHFLSLVIWKTGEGEFISKYSGNNGYGHSSLSLQIST